MKLIGTQTSPYTRKVRVVLAEKRIEYAFEEDVPSAPETRVPEFNPLGKVPVLVMDDGTTLYDSRVIVEFLDAASPVTRLIPDVTRGRVQVRRWEALADGVCDAASADRCGKTPPGAQAGGCLDRASVAARSSAGCARSPRSWPNATGASATTTASPMSRSESARTTSTCASPRSTGAARIPISRSSLDKLFKRASFRDSAPPRG